MKRAGIFWCLVAFLSITFSVLTGCSKPPTEQIIKAEKAVDDARQKEADLYVPNIFSKAEENLKRAKDLVSQKKYKEAKIAAEETEKIAEQAILLIEPNKAKMKKDAETLMEEIQKELDEFKLYVAKTIKKKNLADSNEIQTTIGKWEIDMANIKDNLRSQKIKQAYDDLNAIKIQISQQKQTFPYRK